MHTLYPTSQGCLQMFVQASLSARAPGKRGGGGGGGGDKGGGVGNGSSKLPCRCSICRSLAVSVHISMHMRHNLVKLALLSMLAVCCLQHDTVGFSHLTDCLKHHFCYGRFQKALASERERVRACQKSSQSASLFLPCTRSGNSDTASQRCGTYWLHDRVNF